MAWEIIVMGRGGLARTYEDTRERALNAAHEILRGYYNTSKHFVGMNEDSLSCTLFYSKGRVVGMVVKSE